MRWLCVLASMTFFHSNAQNICLHIMENSIKMENDSLKFKMTLSNDYSDSYVMYNLNYPSIDHNSINAILDRAMPRLLIGIIDENNELPKKISASTAPIDYNSMSLIINKYQIVNANCIDSINVVVSLKSIELTKGFYRLQVRYFSNNYYKKELLKARKIDSRLKNSKLFKGVLKSNICSFAIEKPISSQLE